MQRRAKPGVRASRSTVREPQRERRAHDQPAERTKSRFDDTERWWLGAPAPSHFGR
jgi:hypothetical protein